MEEIKKQIAELNLKAQDNLNQPKIKDMSWNQKAKDFLEAIFGIEEEDDDE